MTCSCFDAQELVQLGEHALDPAVVVFVERNNPAPLPGGVVAPGITVHGLQQLLCLAALYQSTAHLLATAVEDLEALVTKAEEGHRQVLEGALFRVLQHVVYVATPPRTVADVKTRLENKCHLLLSKDGQRFLVLEVLEVNGRGRHAAGQVFRGVEDGIQGGRREKI